MELASKLKYASDAIRSIMRHDDAPFEEVHQYAQALRTLIDDELRVAPARRAAAKPKSEPKE